MVDGPIEVDQVACSYYDVLCKLVDCAMQETPWSSSSSNRSADEWIGFEQTLLGLNEELRAAIAGGRGTSSRAKVKRSSKASGSSVLDVKREGELLVLRVHVRPFSNADLAVRVSDSHLVFESTSPAKAFSRRLALPASVEIATTVFQKAELVVSFRRASRTLRDVLSGTSQSAMSARQSLKVFERNATPIDLAFVVRCMAGVAQLVDRIPDTQMSTVVSAPTDIGVLLRALEEPESIAALEQDDPLANARLRGVETRQALLNAEGGAVSVSALGRILKLTRQAVDKRRRANRLLALPMAARGHAYPVWQIENGEVLKGLEAVLDALREWDPWVKASFFLSPNARLETHPPLEWLRRGKIEQVLEAARSFGEHGAD